MKISAVIAEFNPMHKGHVHLINKARQNGATHIAAVMSGNFVQRGECAIYSKWDRALDAVKNGVDIVFEIPSVKAVSSAANFAGAGIEIIEKTGCIEELFFGSECGDINILKHIADVLSTDEFKSVFEDIYSLGYSYPVARKRAFEQIGEFECSKILDNPNDILGIEYIRALKMNDSLITPVCFKRIGDAHDSVLNGEFSSSFAIRQSIINKTLESKYSVHSLINCERAVLYKLRQMSAEQLQSIPDVDEGLENRIRSAIKDSTSVSEIIEKCKTKRYTHSRLRRIILCAFLSISRYDLYSPLQYIKVLCFNEKGREMLRIMKNTSALPVILKHSDIYDIKSKEAEMLYENEVRFSDLYALMSNETEICSREQQSNAFFVKNIDKL